MNEDIYSRRDFLSHSLCFTLSSVLLSCAHPQPVPSPSTYQPPLEPLISFQNLRRLNKVADPEDLIGQLAPSFYQQDVNPYSSRYGEYFGPQDFGGKIVVLGLLVSWSGSCLEQLLKFAAFQRAHPGDVSVLGLTATSNSWDHRIFADRSYSLPIFGERGKASLDFSLSIKNTSVLYRQNQEYPELGSIIAQYFYGIPRVDPYPFIFYKSLPTIFVIDRQQIVREFIVGKVDVRRLDRVVEKYF